ncbi:MAG: VWA domain-containing protein [Spirochaetota bacterium]|nr:VWA domain-containing protein [Spirochaetota bacterium]
MKRKLFLLLGLILLISSLLNADIDRRQRGIAKKFFEEGIYHFNQQEYTAASNSLIRAISSDPNYYKARFWLGKSYFQSGYVKNALIEWERVLNFIGEDYLLKNKIIRLLHQNMLNLNLEVDENYLPTKSFSVNKKYRMQNPVSIYVDKNKHSWVVGYSSNNVIIYDKNGKIIDSLSKGDINFKHPYDVIINSKGDIYISDFGNDRIHKFNSNKKYLFSYGKSGSNDKEFYGPQGLAIDENDNLYVVDKGNHRIQKFDDDGNFLIMFGKSGNEKDELLNPTDIAIVKDKIYVTDTGNKRIQIYDMSGNWIKNIGEDIFTEPKGIKRFSDKIILVTDSQKGIFEVVLNPVRFKIIKKNEKNLKSPLDVALDENHFLYIADLFQDNVLVYVPEKMKYNNLDVTVLQSFTTSFPKITHKVLIRDQSGKSIFGLKNSNLKVFEENITHDVKIIPEYNMKKGISLIILNEKSNSMKKHTNHLAQIAKKLLRSLSVKDQVKVLNFNREYWLAQPFIKNVLSPLKAILEKPKDQNNSDWNIKSIGKALYQGVTDQFSELNYLGAIVIITSGELEENTFDPYGYEVCLNYAKNNNIPVYVISFSDGKMKDELVDLAKITGGKYYNAYTSNDLNHIVKNIRNYKKSIYYVQYNSRIKQEKIFRWREVKVEVKLKDLFGQDKIGYFTN